MKKKAVASQKSFTDWLKAVPTLEDCNEEEITINVQVTLSARAWLLIAHVAANHSQTIDQAVNDMVEDVSLDDDFMNRREHLWESEQRHDKERAEYHKALEKEERQKREAENRARSDDDNDGEEWKTASE